ncbi:polyprenol phosphomannose-dependent alpha 1,6 mannosyltransferase MptB [Pseudonocardia sp. CA-107938]|uniref:polyprenol phosphomannose-dependent alpha 1,6 mannosyltransferase MptB n=1 Tax=Pseudonocardia sp. CA-107938 TaxID=3240021 RepID=UPI003D8D1EBF
MSLSPPVDEPAPPAVDVARTWSDRLGRPSRGPLLLGFVASLMMLVGSFGAGGVLVRDPILTNSPLGFWRYGHGNQLAAFLVYGGVGLMVWAWIRLGRDVLAGRTGGRAVLTTSLVWTFPLLFGPPLFTRDVYSYLAQGALPLFGFDPYAVGPDAMPGVIADNVHSFWQGTPAPYGPLFILVAKGVAAIVGDNMILGVFLMRIALLPGLALLVWSLPGLTRRLGGRVPVAVWALIANPVMVILMIGGGHNDLLVIGLLCAGAWVALRGVEIAGRDAGPALGVALVTMSMAVKASAAVALPFLVLLWAMQMHGTQLVRILKAIGAGVVVFGVTFAACTLAARVDLGWLPALSAPSMIVNWMSLPTGAGELLHSLVSIFVTVPKQPFVNVMRAIGVIILVVVAVKQWLAARDGGPDAIRRAGVVLLLVAILSPALLPWYVSWGFTLLAATALSLRWLQLVAFVSPMLVICYYPAGEDALYNPPYLLFCAALSLLAAVSLARVDPLRLAAGARTRVTSPPTLTAVPTPEAPAITPPVPVEEPAGPTPAGAQQHAG